MYHDEDETTARAHALRRRSVRLGQALGLDGVFRVNPNGSATIELPAGAVERLLAAYEATNTPIGGQLT